MQTTKNVGWWGNMRYRVCALLIALVVVFAAGPSLASVSPLLFTRPGTIAYAVSLPDGSTTQLDAMVPKGHNRRRVGCGFGG